MSHRLVPCVSPATPLASFPLLSDPITGSVQTVKEPTVREQLPSRGVDRPEQLTDENKGIGNVLCT